MSTNTGYAHELQNNGQMSPYGTLAYELDRRAHVKGEDLKNIKGNCGSKQRRKVFTQRGFYDRSPKLWIGDELKTLGEVEQMGENENDYVCGREDEQKTHV